MDLQVYIQGTYVGGRGCSKVGNVSLKKFISDRFKC